MRRKYNDSDSSDEEGFQRAEIKILESSIPTNIVDNIKIGDARQLIAKKCTYVCSSIYTNINLIAYPHFLYHTLEDSSIKMEKNKNKDQVQTETVQLKQLGQYLKSGNYRCVYNKFNYKIDYKLDMTSFYKSFQYYLNSFQSNYKQFTGKDVSSTDDIQFSSNFQSGNLQFVFQNDNTYYLLLQNDINTHGYNQWFYFRIRNKRKCKVKLQILNISKPISLMKTAMGISIFSMQQKSFCRKYWTEGGNNVKLYKNGFRRKTKNNKNNQFYTLQFDYQFKFQSDAVYFAMNIPFTYTKLLNSIDEITAKKSESIALNVKILGRTVSKNNIYSLQFVKKQNHPRSSRIEPSKNNFQLFKQSGSTMVDSDRAQSLFVSSEITAPKKRQSIVFIGRQHPSQTNSSYVLQGIINFLSEESNTSLFILQQYNVYIIPMANPDGVVHGHSRTNLCGYDINRQWGECNQQRSNEVFMISNYLKSLAQSTDIKYVFDFHSHSKKFNTFGYFCEDSVEMRSFAWFLQYTNSNFDYSSCVFGKNKNKDKTFRKYAFDLGINNSITIQVSYFGKCEHGLYRKYNTKQLHDIGATIIKAIGQFSQTDVSKVIINNYVKSNLPNLPVEEQLSESDPQEDYLEQRQRVKIILSGRRKKESQQPKGFIRQGSQQRPKQPQKINSLLTKTMINLQRQRESNTKTALSTNYPDKTHTYSFTEKPFKPYSQEQMLRDDSLMEQSPQGQIKRRIRTENNRKSQSRLYLWDQDKYCVNKLISYPTCLRPYIQKLVTDSKSLDGSPIKNKRNHIHPRHSSKTEIQLQKLIVDSRNRQAQKYRCITQEEKQRKCRLSRFHNKKMIPHVMTVNSFQRFRY